MSTFRNNDGYQEVEINQETLAEFKNWLNNDRRPEIGRTGFTVAKDVPFSELVPNNVRDEQKLETVTRVIGSATERDKSRINEMFDLGSVAPQIPLTVLKKAGNRTGGGHFYHDLTEVLKARPMSDNLALVAGTTKETYVTDSYFSGQKENITSLPPEKRKALGKILDTYDSSEGRYTNDMSTYLQIEFMEKIYGRGDLLNYDGLNPERRKLAIKKYSQGSRKYGREILAELDEKYWTVDIFKEVGGKDCYNVYFEKNDRYYGRTTSNVPEDSGEYAKKDTTKAKTQEEKNANILPEDYKKARDFLIKESQKRNKKSANAGFQDLCCELFGVKSYDQIPAGQIKGILADVNLRTAQQDVLDGNAKNLSVEALQLVLRTDKRGFYARHLSPEDISTVERYGSRQSQKVSLSGDTRMVMNRGDVLSPDRGGLYGISGYDSRKLTLKEKEAMLARSESVWKAETVGFMLPIEGKTTDQERALTQEFIVLASDAVQQKKDFTPEQKARLKKLTGQSYSAQDVLNIVDMQYEDGKKLSQSRLETCKKVEAVARHTEAESKRKSTVAEEIRQIQVAYQAIQKCSKKGKFEAKDEEAYKPENVEKLIASYIERGISGDRRDIDGLSQIEKPGFMGAMFAPRKESERVALNGAVGEFNRCLNSLLSHSDLTELRQYSGEILSPKTQEQSTQKAEEAKQTNETVRKLKGAFYDTTILFGPSEYKDKQLPVAEQIYAASPVPVEQLKLESYVEGYHGKQDQERLSKMEEYEPMFAEAREQIVKPIKGKKREQDAKLEQEAAKQSRLEDEKKRDRTRAAREKLRARAGNNTLLEQIDEGIKAKEEAKSQQPQAIDKLAVKEALKRRELENR